MDRKFLFCWMGAFLLMLFAPGLVYFMLDTSTFEKSGNPLNQNIGTLCSRESEYLVPVVRTDFIGESTGVAPLSFFLIRQFDDRERILIQLEFLGTGIVVDRFYRDSILIETTETIKKNTRLKKIQYVGVSQYLSRDQMNQIFETQEFIDLPGDLIDPDWLDYIVRTALLRNLAWLGWVRTDLCSGINLPDGIAI